MKILVLNGPNLNMLGIREPEHYGKETYSDLENKIKAHCEGKCEVEIKQTNHEGVLVEYIQNAYFSDDRIVKELIAARSRGVDVRVILPNINDVGIMDAVNRYMANKLFKNGVRVYFYNGMSHVKAAVFDGFAVVGSANFDKMSLYVNREMSLGIYDPSFVSQLTERLFEKDFNNSQEMTAPLDLSWTHAIINGLTNQL